MTNSPSSFEAPTNSEFTALTRTHPGRHRRSSEPRSSTTLMVSAAPAIAGPPAKATSCAKIRTPPVNAPKIDTHTKSACPARPAHRKPRHNERRVDCAHRGSCAQHAHPRRPWCRISCAAKIGTRRGPSQQHREWVQRKQAGSNSERRTYRNPASITLSEISRCSMRPEPHAQCAHHRQVPRGVKQYTRSPAPSSRDWKKVGESGHLKSGLPRAGPVGSFPTESFRR